MTRGSPKEINHVSLFEINHFQRNIPAIKNGIIATLPKPAIHKSIPRWAETTRISMT